MRPTIDSDFFSLPPLRAFGHRGSGGTHPENTLPSFQAAVDAGASYLETDVHMTRDGEIVISHDDNLERTCAMPGRIREMTYAEIATADAAFSYSPDGAGFPFRGKGIRVPRLGEVLSTFRKHRFNIDIKPDQAGIVGPALKVIEAAGMRRMVLLASEHQERLNEIRALAPAIPTSFGYHEVAGFLAEMASGSGDYTAPGEALQIPPEYYSWKLATPQTVEVARRFGVEVHVWTINDEAEMRSMVEVGVQGIMSDFPARLLSVIRRNRR
jgi:glycerophosphoryl diester phosphodiesterase